ncbi:MAG: glycosyl hydrolase family 28-related protein [Planctomycetota bacterium]|jgi:polygalacturonase
MSVNKVRFLTVLVPLVLTCYVNVECLASSTFDIRDFGAVADGKIANTDGINKAIVAANTARGGTVLFPSGE